MAYRYTDTGKWDDAWFIDLSNPSKLLFLFLCDNCDVAGFYEISYRKLTHELQMTEQQIKGAFKGLVRGLIVSDCGTVLLLRKFLKHQKNLPINFENNAHKGILRRFENYTHKFSNLHIDNNIGFNQLGASEPLPRGTGNGKGNDKGNGKKPREEKKPCPPPTVEDVKAYATANGYDPSFIWLKMQGYIENGMKDSHGNMILNWKLKLNQVWFKPESKNTNQPEPRATYADNNLTAELQAIEDKHNSQ